MSIAVTSQQILQLGLENLRASIIRRSRDAGQEASGETYASIRVEGVTETHGELWGPTWIAVLEDGRRPGKIPYEFADRIMEWAAFKGISWASADPVLFERWARGVAWNIARHGTKLYRSGQKIDIFETPVADFEKWLTAKMKEFYAAYVANEIRTAWQNG